MSIDTKLAAWFQNDMSNGLLRSIALTTGTIRGLKPFQINFDFPISVIAGGNGSGKTTLLALAACAFHNREDGFKLNGRKLPYYTISDFFIQSSSDVSPKEIVIRYYIAHNNWAVGKNNDSPSGVLSQALAKIKGGKWRTYENRVRRNVVFFGIDRVVPHSEKSVSKSYRSIFKKTLNGCEDSVRDSVGRVLGKKYEEFHFKSHSKYRLPFVQQGTLTYSGFNMGAGENALFEIFYTLYVCPEGSLAIIDEIELGLHTQAQKRLMAELKNICLERKLQIICTTHSGSIISEVPAEGRFFIKNYAEGTTVIPSITPDFATGLLSGINSQELTVYVEDEVAKDLLEAVLDKNMRSRIMVRHIGSAAAVLSLMAGLRKEGLKENCIAVLDGDKAKNYDSQVNIFLNKLESFSDKEKEIEWIKERLFMLPGSTWPENWVMGKLSENMSEDFAKQMGADLVDIKAAVQNAINAGKHKEYFSFSKEIIQELGYVKKVVSRYVAMTCGGDFSEILNTINSKIS